MARRRSRSGRRLGARRARPALAALRFGPLLEDDSLGLLRPQLLPDPAAHVENQLRDRDLGRADRGAGVAGDAEALWVGHMTEPVVDGGQRQPDRAGVDVAEEVAADDLVGRADVGAGAAADAVERLAQLR